MSRAFVKESDEVLPLPERPISPHPNLVTAQGLLAIESEMALLEAALAASDPADRDVASKVGRELRYWRQRRASAQLVLRPSSLQKVAFDTSVTIHRDDGQSQVWRIVGEDEANPAKGNISYISPLAKAMLNQRVGADVRFGQIEAQIVGIA